LCEYLRVSPELFRESVAHGRVRLAGELGCGLDALSSHALTVVPTPAVRHENSLALIATCGLGTVFSIAAAMVDWVRENAPEPHFRAMQPFFLADVAAKARERGFEGASPRGFSLGFVLAELPPPPAALPGYALAELDAAEIVRLRATKEFDNALAEPDEPRIAAFRTAFALLDGAGFPAAVAGIWDEGHGIDEIGVDVRRDARGGGLAKAVVNQATRDILDRGRAPIYTCGATNVRSHNNAIACGFRPLWTAGRIWVPPAAG
jgi:GNAT superfamily N-acetyltransferase